MINKSIYLIQLKKGVKRYKKMSDVFDKDFWTKYMNMKLNQWIEREKNGEILFPRLAARKFDIEKDVTFELSGKVK